MMSEFTYPTGAFSSLDASQHGQEFVVSHGITVPLGLFFQNEHSLTNTYKSLLAVYRLHGEGRRLYVGDHIHYYASRADRLAWMEIQLKTFKTRRLLTGESHEPSRVRRDI